MISNQLKLGQRVILKIDCNNISHINGTFKFPSRILAKDNDYGDFLMISPSGNLFKSLSNPTLKIIFYEEAYKYFGCRASWLVPRYIDSLY